MLTTMMYVLLFCVGGVTGKHVSDKWQKSRRQKEDEGVVDSLGLITEPVPATTEMDGMLSFLMEIANGNGHPDINGKWTDWSVDKSDFLLSINKDTNCLLFKNGEHQLSVRVGKRKFEKIINEKGVLSEAQASAFSVCFLAAHDFHLAHKIQRNKQEKATRMAQQEADEALLHHLNLPVPTPLPLVKKEQETKSGLQALYTWMDACEEDVLQDVLQRLKRTFDYLEDHQSWMEDLEQLHQYIRLRDTRIPALLQAYLAFAPTEKKEHQPELLQSLQLISKNLAHDVRHIQRTKKQNFDKQQLLIRP